MDETTVFDQLVAGLDRSDRKKLLQEIEASFAETSDSLAAEEDDVEEIFDPELELARLGIFQRLLLHLTALFLSVNIRDLLKRRLVKKLKEKINARSYGLVDFRSGVLTEKMRNRLVSLRQVARFFSEPVGQALKERRSFVPFLAGLELELVQQKLAGEIAMLDELKVFEDQVEIQHTIEAKCEKIIEEIPETDRAQVYRDVQALYALRALTAFGFDSLMERFSVEGSGGATAKLSAVRSRLAELAEVLNSLTVSPSTVALEALFLYRWRSRLRGEWQDFSADIGDSLMSARTMLARIRDFNRRIPLVLIVRYATENLNWIPRRQGGGEDWFVLYKEFWSQKVSRACRTAYLKRKRHDLRLKAAAMFGLPQLPEIAGARDLDLDHRLSLQFLKGFTQTVFDTFHRPLKLVYLNGEFYKDQNQKEYTDVFDFVGALPERIRSLERELEPAGRFGARLAEARSDAAGGQNRKVRDVAQDVDAAARAVVDRAIAEIHSLVSLLGGIFEGQPGEKYDTLSNLESIGGRENKKLMDGLRAAAQRIGECWQLLCEIRDVEIAG